MRKDAFQNLIQQILKEEIEKRDSIKLRVPEMDSRGIDPGKKNKTFSTSDANSRDSQSKESLLADLITVVKEIDDTVSVVWDDHDDLMINGRDLKFIRISPRWEDYYVIEMMTRNEDRIWITGLDWEQVKEFVKINLKNLYNQPTAVDKAYDKSYRNRKDQTPAPDKRLSQKDKPDILPLTNEPVKNTKNKNKNYTEDQTKKDEDLPDKPMKEVGDDYKKLTDYKVKDPVKLRKRKPNTKLVVKQS
jgi:hypothetical protein